MRSLVQMAIVLLATPVTSQRAQDSAVAHQEFGGVSGRVVEAVTGRPLRAVLTILQNGRVVRQGIADSLGYYHVDSIPPGVSEMLVRAFEFRAQRLELDGKTHAQSIDVVMHPISAALAAVVLHDTRPRNSVTVSRTTIRAEIPLGRDASGTWSWNEPETEAGRAEYMLSVAFDGDPTYALAFALFKFPGALPQRGSLEQLLSVGQVNLLRVVGHRENPVPDVTPSARGDGSSLVFQLRHIATASALWSDRPREARIVVMMPGRDEVVFKVPVTYDSTTRAP